MRRNHFTGPRDMNRLGWDAVKLRERALDGFAIDLGLIHSSGPVVARPGLTKTRPKPVTSKSKGVEQK
jgi:hypothetical protein